MLFVHSCISTKPIYRTDSLVVKKVGFNDDNVVSFNVRFKDSFSVKDRIKIIKGELELRYGMNDTSYTIEESYGKLYNEYIYIIRSVHCPLKNTILSESQ